MSRNMQKTVERAKGKIPCNYDLKMSELYGLVQSVLEKQTTGAVYDAVTMAFYYGFELGARATERGKYKTDIKGV